jgi:hypothetical protein
VSFNETITLQAMVDSEMTRLPEHERLSTKPSQYTEPQLSISQDRAKMIHRTVKIEDFV